LAEEFEGDVEPEASEPALPMPASLEQLWPAEVKQSVDLERAYVRELSLVGVLKELRRPSCRELRDSDRTKGCVSH